MQHRLFLFSSLNLQILLRRLPSPASIFPNMLFPSIFVRFEHLNLLAIHMLRNLIRLPFLEGESQSLMTVIFIIGLVFVIFYSDEITVYG